MYAVKNPHNNTCSVLLQFVLTLFDDARGAGTGGCHQASRCSRSSYDATTVRGFVEVLVHGIDCARHRHLNNNSSIERSRF